MNITKKEMVAAFTEWAKQVEENPDNFMSTEELLGLSNEEAGEFRMEFFVKLVKNSRKA